MLFLFGSSDAPSLTLEQEKFGKSDNFRRYLKTVHDKQTQLDLKTKGETYIHHIVENLYKSKF